MTQHQLLNRTEDEVLWFQRRNFIKAAAAWTAMGGFEVAQAQSRSNVVSLMGDALVNGTRLRPDQTIQTGDRLETGPGSNLVFVLGTTSFQVRQSSMLTVERGATLSAVSVLRLFTGAVASVPLVNEVVIGLKDKDRFNASKPSGDTQFAQYVTNPTLPVLIDAVLALGGAAPTNTGRVDLQTVFLTGIAGVNQMTTVTPSEMLRLNTAIAPVAFAAQNRLGIVGNILAAGTDNAGYPNGRRPKDDVVNISLVAVMGGLCIANGTTNALGFGAACNPSAVAAPLRAVGTNGIPTVFNLHDAVDQATAETFLTTFPYLNTPLGGTAPAP